MDATSGITEFMNGLAAYNWNESKITDTDVMQDNVDVRAHLEDAGKRNVEQGTVVNFAEGIYGAGTTLRFEGWCDEFGRFFGAENTPEDGSEEIEEMPVRPVELNLPGQNWNLYAVYTVCIPGADGSWEEILCSPCVLDGQAKLGFLRLQKIYMLALPAENYIILPQSNYYRMQWTKNGVGLATDTITIGSYLWNRYGLIITLL